MVFDFLYDGADDRTEVIIYELFGNIAVNKLVLHRLSTILLHYVPVV